MFSWEKGRMIELLGAIYRVEKGERKQLENAWMGWFLKPMEGCVCEDVFWNFFEGLSVYDVCVFVHVWIHMYICICIFCMGASIVCI